LLLAKTLLYIEMQCLSACILLLTQSYFMHKKFKNLNCCTPSQFPKGTLLSPTQNPLVPIDEKIQIVSKCLDACETKFAILTLIFQIEDIHKVGSVDEWIGLNFAQRVLTRHSSQQEIVFPNHTESYNRRLTPT
jgi:hypothetical protein